MANHDLVRRGMSTAVQMGAERVGCSSDALKRASEKVTMKDGRIAFEGLSQEEAMAMKGLMDQIGFKGSCRRSESAAPALCPQMHRVFGVPRVPLRRGVVGR